VGVRCVRRWKRYVYDVFAIAPATMVDEVLLKLNGAFPGISFNTEGEENRMLPFLDVLVSRGKISVSGITSLETTVFRKATSTDKCLDYRSHHSDSNKQGVALCFLSRAKDYCSTSAFRRAEEDHVLNMIGWNNYPSREIKMAQRYLDRKARLQAEGTQPSTAVGQLTLEQTTRREGGLTVLPYVEGLSHKVKRVVVNAGVRCVSRPLRTLRQILTRVKPSVEKMQRSSTASPVRQSLLTSFQSGQFRIDTLA